MIKHKIRKMTGDYNEWLVASLKNKKEAVAYLQAALDEYQNDGNTEALLLSLRHLTEAQGGVGELSRKTHLNRESLYKTLSRRGNPKLQTLAVLFKGLGFHLFVKAVG